MNGLLNFLNDYLKKNFVVIIVGLICIYFIYCRCRRKIMVNGKFVDTGDYKVVVIINKDLEMSKGKILSQFGHAIDALHEKLLENQNLAKIWRNSGSAKIAVKGTTEDMVRIYNEAKKEGIVYVKIFDAGRTQVNPGSFTVMAIGPASKQKIDNITGSLKLY